MPKLRMKNKYCSHFLFFKCVIFFMMIGGAMHGQTTISPILGYDFAKFKTHSMPDDLLAVSFHFTEKGYSSRSLLAGIEFDQYLGWRIAVAASFSLTRKTMDAVEYNITDLQAVQLVTYRNNVFINYLLLNNVSIGCGYDYNLMNNYKKKYNGQFYRSNDRLPPNEHGVSFNVSYYYRQFVMRAYYHRGLKDNSVYGANAINFLPINYFGFWLGYRIKLFDPIKIGGKKQSCPTF